MVVGLVVGTTEKLGFVVSLEERLVVGYDHGLSDGFVDGILVRLASNDGFGVGS